VENKEHLYWSKIRRLGIFSAAFPLIIFVVAVTLYRKGMPPLIVDYSEGMARILQYLLFGIGVAIFFFCDAISDFFANRLFVKDRQREKENLSSYFAYTFITLWLLNMISTLGFVGFLICGNLTWLTVFVILNFSLQTRYFPSEGRFNKLVETVKK